MKMFLFWFILITVGAAIGYIGGSLLGIWGLLITIPLSAAWGFVFSQAAWGWAVGKRSRF